MTVTPLVPPRRPKYTLAAAVLLLACASCAAPPEPPRAPFVATPQLKRALNMVLSWPVTAHVSALKGAVLFRDGAGSDVPEVAIARAVLHTNPRIAQAAALLLAVETANAARRNGLPPEFLGATLLQESAYDVEALSAAGAIGIAQFIPETAAGIGIDPYDPFAAIGGSAELLGSYVAGYRGVYDDPYAAALAAYNAGPAAVARYHGIPPYAETKEYIALIFDRWAQIVSYERTRSRGGRSPKVER